MDARMKEKVAAGQGFIAALDQSGGSTPKALKLYGITADQYSGESQMFDLIHEMRTRIMTSPSFTGEKILGAILFEQTMDREVEGRGTADYLWNVKRVVPFLKVDKGLEDEADGVQLMKPIPGLNELCQRAVAKGVFGTKMRSVINRADASGIMANVSQQFILAKQILAQGLMPIIEPEVSIKAADKAECEQLLKSELYAGLDSLPADTQVMFKLTLPSENGFYSDLVADPRVLKVVALSGGYSRAEANELLAQNPGVIASFSRALTEGLTAQQTEAEFDELLAESVDSIYRASIA